MEVVLEPIHALQTQGLCNYCSVSLYPSQTILCSDFVRARCCSSMVNETD